MMRSAEFEKMMENTRTRSYLLDILIRFGIKSAATRVSMGKPFSLTDLRNSIRDVKNNFGQPTQVHMSPAQLNDLKALYKTKR